MLFSDEIHFWLIGYVNKSIVTILEKALQLKNAVFEVLYRLEVSSDRTSSKIKPVSVLSFVANALEP